jgi:hypothetical protein
MGGFPGHLVPGIVLTFYGVCWTILSLANHFYAKKRRRERGRHELEKGTSTRLKKTGFEKWEHAIDSYSWLPFPCAPRVPVEPVCKIVFTFIGMFIELLLELDKQGHFYWFVSDFTTHPVDPEKIQHATMYAFFFLSGIVDLIVMCNGCEIPRKAGKVLFSVAFLAEGSLFLFHTSHMQHSLLNLRVHLLLGVGGLSCGIAAALRVFKGRNIFINLFFSLSLSFEGTWLLQAAYTLYVYGDLWHGNNYMDVMYISVIALWHVLGGMVFTLLMWLFVWLVYKYGHLLVHLVTAGLPEKWRRRFCSRIPWSFRDKCISLIIGVPVVANRQDTRF